MSGELVVSQQITFANVLDGVSPIKIEIITTNGNTFKNNVIGTTLKAKLYRDDEEIDKDGTDFCYIWTKINEDETPDNDWNQDHSYSQKSIRITETDVFRRATFSCMVEYIGKQN